jgi:hypothetical protein
MLLWCCGCLALTAQEPTPATEPYVLHVYTNLIQLPTLVLGDDLQPVPPVIKDSFEVRIDSGTPFHPTSLRREGNDPISLGVLLDLSGDSDELIKTLADSLPQLAPKFLHPQDHVSIFVLDCKLIRSLDDVPATPDTLKRGVDAALHAPNVHGEKKKGACGGKLALRNAIAQVTHALGEAPGRRVLLAVTDGHDGGSSYKWAEVQTYAASKGVAVFGFRDVFNSRFQTQTSGLSGRGVPTITGQLSDEDLFRAMCESNGGIVVSTTRFQLFKDLEQFITNLRERYIVEFPRPDDAQPGLHDIQVRVSKMRYIVHSTGVSVSMPDPHEADDPNTVPVSKSPATYGKRRPLAPSH